MSHKALEFLQVADAAEIAKVTPAAISLAINEGRLRIAGRTRRGIRLLLLGDVLSFAEARTPRRRAAEQPSRRVWRRPR